MDKDALETQIEAFDFGPLFIETLGWDRFNAPSRVTRIEPGQRGLGPNIQGPPVFRSKNFGILDQHTYLLHGTAQKRGVQVFVCSSDAWGRIPNSPTRSYIQTQIAKQARENLIIYTDRAQSSQVWQWVDRTDGEVEVCEHSYSLGASNATFLQRLAGIVFQLQEEERLTLLDVLLRLRSAFSVTRDRVKRGPYSRLRLWEYDFSKLHPGLRFWLQRVYQIPRLTRLEEIELFRSAACGDIEARNCIVEAHLYLVVEMAWKLNRVAELEPQDLLDVIQEGHIRLIGAVERFDYTLGWRFQTIAASHVRRTLDRAFLQKSRPVFIPNYVGDVLPSILKRFEEAEASLRQERQREPEAADIAEIVGMEFGIQSSDLLNLRMLSQDFHSLELLTEDWNEKQQEEAEEDQRDGFDILTVALQDYDRETLNADAVTLIRREQLDAVLDKLTPRERDVVRMRFGLDDGYAHTLDEVGQRFAVTRERVRQIELRALKKLRRMGPVDIRDEKERTTDGS